MTVAQLAYATPPVLAAFLAGLLVGLAYFALLRRSVRLLVRPESIGSAVVLTLGRIAGVGGFLVVMARLGALPLVVSFIGFLAARTMTVQRARRAG